jgi:hypothetical protein
LEAGKAPPDAAFFADVGKKFFHKRHRFDLGIGTDNSQGSGIARSCQQMLLKYRIFVGSYVINCFYLYEKS